MPEKKVKRKKAARLSPGQRITIGAPLVPAGIAGLIALLAWRGSVISIQPGLLPWFFYALIVSIAFIAIGIALLASGFGWWRPQAISRVSPLQWRNVFIAAMIVAIVGALACQVLSLLIDRGEAQRPTAALRCFQDSRVGLRETQRGTLPDVIVYFSPDKVQMVPPSDVTIHDKTGSIVQLSAAPFAHCWLTNVTQNTDAQDLTLSFTARYFNSIEGRWIGENIDVPVDDNFLRHGDSLEFGVANFGSALATLQSAGLEYQDSPDGPKLSHSFATSDVDPQALKWLRPEYHSPYPFRHFSQCHFYGEATVEPHSQARLTIPYVCSPKGQAAERKRLDQEDRTDFERLQVTPSI